jgi:hypothetical protein
VRVSADVTYDVANEVVYRCIGVTGTLRFRPVSKLNVGTLLAYDTGRLECGDLDTPCRANVAFAGTLNLTTDPEQYGIGLIVLGTIRWYGDPREPFVRLAGDVPAGTRVLTLSQPMPTWKVWDTVVVPDTRQVSGKSVWQIETRQIAAIDGTRLTLSAPLTYAHPGAHDPDGALKFAPHIANLTRSTVFRSALPAGTRGHVILVNRADVDIRHTAFADLGRTRWDTKLDSTTFDSGGSVKTIGSNQIGRYSLHLHHLFGPSDLPADVPQFTILGNVVLNSSRWGVALHNAHFGLVQDNVIVNAGGAGIVTEDGSETGNLIDHNFVLGTPGTGQRGDSRGNKEFGFGGDGIWLRGPRNRVTRNVSATNRSYGLSYFSNYLRNVRLPMFKGADTSVAGEYTIADGNTLQILENSSNEIYGATENGVEYWWLGAFGKCCPKANAPLQLFRNLRVWHTYHKAVFNYTSVNVTFENLMLRGDLGAQGTNYGFEGGDYLADNLRIVNPDIRGKRIGIKPSQWANTVQRIEGGVLQNAVDIYMDGLPTSAYRSDGIPPRRVVVSGTRFLAPPYGPHLSIKMRYSSNPTRTLIQTDRLTVTNLNGVTGDNVAVYYQEQAPSFLVPQTRWNVDRTPRLFGAPVANLTNAQTWSRYRIAIAGAVAPCTLIRPDIQGFVCPVR